MAKREAKTKGSVQVATLPDARIPPIYLRHYFYNEPHEKLLPRGALTDGRTLANAFGELAKEGKAAMHTLFRKGGFQYLRPATERLLVATRKWNGYLEELDGITLGKSNYYGATLERTRRVWMKFTVRINTEEEAASEISRNGYTPTVERLLENTSQWYRNTHPKEGMEHAPTPAILRRYRVDQFLLPDLSEGKLAEHYRTHPLPLWYAMGTNTDAVEVTGPEEPITPPLEFLRPLLRDIPRDQLFTAWLEEYAAEIMDAADKFAEDPELPHAILGLVEELRTFAPATYNAKELRPALEGKADGVAFLAATERERGRLVRKLEEIATEYVDPIPPNGTAMQGSTDMPKITWKGNTQELAVLIDLLEREGWIDGGRSRSQLATRVASLFIRSDGQPLDLGSLKTYMGKAYKPTPRAGVEFTATRNPDKT